MSKQEADIIKGLRAIAASATLLIPGKVVNVDMKMMTCEIRDLDGFTWHDVRIQALTPASDGVVLIPEVNSDVIIGRIDDADCFCILVYSKIADVCMHISGQYVMANQAENLFGLVNTLLDALAQAVITTPAGPGNFAASTLQQLTEVKTRFGKLFKEK